MDWGIATIMVLVLSKESRLVTGTMNGGVLVELSLALWEWGFFPAWESSNFALSPVSCQALSEAEGHSSALCCLGRSDTGPTFISSSPSTRRHAVPDSNKENNFPFIPAGSAKPLWLGRSELTLLARASSAELFYVASLIPIQANPLFATEHPLQHCLTYETIATNV